MAEIEAEDRLEIKVDVPAKIRVMSVAGAAVYVAELKGAPGGAHGIGSTPIEAVLKLTEEVVRRCRG